VPQFEASVCGFTQLVPQSVSDASQVALHVPSEQTCPLQPVPHCPQLLPSACVSTQLPEQSVRPVRHWQLPLSQSWPGWHAWPQLPQLALSVKESTQLPPQASEPVGHPQLELTQLWSAGHGVPQAPQFCALVVRSVQTPAQLVRPGAQSHAPA
jgi:hypothetical protein